MDGPLAGKRVAIIGAGPSGLVAARALSEQGLDPVVLERSHGIGGQWNTAGGSSGIWPGMRTNTSITLTCFSDFPPDSSLPMFPTSEQILGYLEAYSNHFELGRFIRTGCNVESVERDGSMWAVGYRDPSGQKRESFSAVIVASGRFNKPRWPRDIEGLDGFTGAAGVKAAFEYRGREPYRDQTVLVIGNSISGLEICSELGHDHRIRVISACRKPRYIVQKIAQGVPTDWRFFTRFATLLGRALPPEETARGFKELVLQTAGNPSRYGGLAPHENVFVADVGQCQHYLSLIAEERILPKPGVRGVEGKRVSFADGTEADVDGIICATGYDLNLPFLSEDLCRLLEIDDTHLELYEHTFHPDLRGMAFIGQYVQVGPYFPVIELQARWIASVWGNVLKLPSSKQMEQGLARFREWKKLGSPLLFHVNAVNLAREAGVAPDLSKRPEITQSLLFGPLAPAQFRLDGPGSRSEALADFRQAISRFGDNGSAHPAPQELEGMKIVTEILGGDEPALKDALAILQR